VVNINGRRLINWSSGRWRNFGADLAWFVGVKLLGAAGPLGEFGLEHSAYTRVKFVPNGTMASIEADRLHKPDRSRSAANRRKSCACRVPQAFPLFEK